MVEQRQQIQQKLSHQKIKINVDEILDKLDCPICMCKFTDPYIAKCGHTFCKVCISECVNRQHECPSCRAKLQKEDLIKNFIFEIVLQRLQEERDLETQKYFHNLAENALQEENQMNQGTSPIETVFLMNLRESLLSYQEYFEQLLKEKEQIVNKIKTSLSQQLLVAKQSEDLQQEQEINNQIKNQISEVDLKFTAAIDSLVQSYDEHMKAIIPKPKLLPIRINIEIQSKNNLRIENLIVKPYENMNDLLNIIEEFQGKRGDPILNWNRDQLQFMLTGPLNLGIHYQNQDEDIEMNSQSQELIQIRNFSDYKLPFSTFNICAGSLITIKGGPVLFTSDKPLECMTLNFDQDPTATYNYFSCKTCNSNCNNRICESCKDGCHKGHVLLAHLMNHRPTWACCYCMKKDICKIANKKNPNPRKV